MTDQDFCKIDTEFYGEEIDNIKQIALRSFTGEELKEYVEAAINYTRCSTELKGKEETSFEIKTLKDLKDAYPDGLTHMIQSENSILKYFVDYELVKTKPLIT